MLHLVAILTFPSSGLYMAFSSSGSDFHIWPKVHSRCELSKLRGRSGRCSWQKTVYGVEYTFLARGAAADPGGARFLVGAELVARCSGPRDAAKLNGGARGTLCMTSCCSPSERPVELDGGPGGSDAADRRAGNESGSESR